MSSAICFNFNQSKILSSGNGLMKKKNINPKPKIVDDEPYSFCNNVQNEKFNCRQQCAEEF